MMKGSIQEEDITVNICAPNIGGPQYTQQMQTAIKGEIDSNAITVGDFNTPLTPMEIHTDRKLVGNIALSGMLSQRDLINIYKTFHPKAAEWFLLKCTWNILWDRSHPGSQIKLQEI